MLHELRMLQASTAATPFSIVEMVVGAHDNSVQCSLGTSLNIKNVYILVQQVCY